MAKKSVFWFVGMLVTVLAFGLVLASCASVGTVASPVGTVADPDSLILRTWDYYSNASHNGELYALSGTWLDLSRERGGISPSYNFRDQKKVVFGYSDGTIMASGEYQFDGTTLLIRVNGALAKASASVSGNTLTVSGFTGRGALNAGLRSYEGTFTRK
jgi:hypothetical protein